MALRKKLFVIAAAVCIILAGCVMGGYAIGRLSLQVSGDLEYGAYNIAARVSDGVFKTTDNS